MELDTLADMVAAVNVSGWSPAPWEQLYAVTNETQRLDDQLTDYIGDVRTLKALSQPILGLQTLADGQLVQVTVHTAIGVGTGGATGAKTPSLFGQNCS